MKDADERLRELLVLTWDLHPPAVQPQCALPFLP